MGRLFVTNVEGPSYQCKDCNRVEIAAYVDPENRIPPDFTYPESFGKLYFFNKCLNVVIGTDVVATITVNGEIESSLREVFCIACNSHLGYYYEGGTMYNEGNFYINRFKLRGLPGGSDDDDNPGNEEEVGVIDVEE